MERAHEKVIGNLSAPSLFNEPSLAPAERPDLEVSGIPNGYAVYCPNEKPHGDLFSALIALNFGMTQAPLMSQDTNRYIPSSQTRSTGNLR